MIKWYLFVQVPQSTPEPQLLTAQAVGERAVKMFSVLQVFCESLCLCLANQTGQESKVVHPHLTQKAGGISLVRFSPLSRGSWTCLSPSCKAQCSPPKLLMCNLLPNPAHRILQSSIWAYFTHKWQERNVIKNQRAYISFFISSRTALGTVFSFKLKWVKLQCPLFATHRSLLNQMFLIL